MIQQSINFWSMMFLKTAEQYFWQEQRNFRIFNDGLMSF